MWTNINILWRKSSKYRIIINHAKNSKHPPGVRGTGRIVQRRFSSWLILGSPRVTEDSYHPVTVPDVQRWLGSTYNSKMIKNGISEESFYWIMNRLIKNIRIILIAQLASRHIELQTNPHNWATRSPHPSDDDFNGSISRNHPSKI